MSASGRIASRRITRTHASGLSSVGNLPGTLKK